MVYINSLCLLIMAIFWSVFIVATLKAWVYLVFPLQWHTAINMTIIKIFVFCFCLFLYFPTERWRSPEKSSTALLWH